MLAKQIFNGVRLYLSGTKLLSDKATNVVPVIDGPERNREDDAGDAR